MDPVTAALLLAVATGASEAVGGKVWVSDITGLFSATMSWKASSSW